MENKCAKINDRWKSDQNGRRQGEGIDSFVSLCVEESKKASPTKYMCIYSVQIDGSEDNKKVTKINQKRVLCNKSK